MSGTYRDLTYAISKLCNTIGDLVDSQKKNTEALSYLLKEVNAPVFVDYDVERPAIHIPKDDGCSDFRRIDYMLNRIKLGKEQFEKQYRSAIDLECRKKASEIQEQTVNISKLSKEVENQTRKLSNNAEVRRQFEGALKRIVDESCRARVLELKESMLKLSEMADSIENNAEYITKNVDRVRDLIIKNSGKGCSDIQQAAEESKACVRELGNPGRARSRRK